MRHSYRYLAATIIAFCAAAPLAAQSDTIVAHPEAKLLRRMWMIYGNDSDELGTRSGRAGDINCDSLADFAVYHPKKEQTWIFLGDKNGPSTTPSIVIDTAGFYASGPLLGDFWGTGHKALGLMRGSIIDSSFFTIEYRLYIYRTEECYPANVPAAVWVSVKGSSSGRVLIPSDFIAADLDRDGFDELIVVASATRRNKVSSAYAEVWIYKGGPDFQVDSPTVVLRDPLANNNSNYYDVSTADIDGDGYLELLTVGVYGGAKLNIYWGGPSLPDSSRLPDRSVFIDGFDVFTPDVDGDGISDVVTNGVHIFRSGNGKDMRTRSYALDDADIDIIGHGRRASYLGPLNDSSERYEMIGVVGANPSGTGAMLLAFSGGPDGPDLAYDAYYAPSSGDIFSQSDGPVGDVDGDGWIEFLCSRRDWPNEIFRYGAAVLLSGGAYIPRDFTSSIRDITLDGKERALSLWPNPVTTELNIAWRGDLARMPRRFVVHDMLGCEVARGEVGAGTSSAQWRCDSVAPGIYLLSVFDRNGSCIATHRVVRQ